MTAATIARRRPPRLTSDHLVASLILTLLSIATAIGMCRVFADWSFLGPLVTMVIAVHAGSLVLRSLRVSSWLAVPITALAVYEIAGLLFYRDTMQLFVPSGDTLELLSRDIRLVWSQFPTAVAPVPSEGAYLITATLGLGLVALLADVFAFRAYGRAEAVMPSGVLFVFTAALGTDRNRVSVAALWIGMAIAVIAVLRSMHSTHDASWLGRRRRAMSAALPATAFCASLAALVAAALGPQLPGAGETPLLDTRQRDGEVTEVLSPLVDIRSRLVNRTNTEMFTVEAGAGRYWRVAGLSEFDGRIWGLPDRDLESASGLLNRPSFDAQVLQQQVRISKMGGNLIPAAFIPLTIAQSAATWLSDTDTLVIDGDGIDEGDVYNIGSDIATPSPDILRASTASSPPTAEFLVLPGLPAEIAQLAREVTAGAATPYDQALALQNWFRTNFAYDLTVQRGHSDDAILSFLRIQRGYCEQFAGTFAVMARTLGLPARVAVGFTQGELRSDGRYHVLGRHAHAWPEVWFDSVGWVLFEPTPGRGAPGSETYTGVAASQDTSTGTPAGAGSPDPAPSTSVSTQVTPTTEPDLDTGPRGTVPAGSSSGGSSGGGMTSTGWVVLALLAAGAWMIAMPHVVRRFTLRGTTPSEQVITAWHGTVGALTLAGAPPAPGATPLEYARKVERELGVDHRSVTELARFVTRAIYSPAGVGEPAALRAAVLHTQLDEASATLMPWTTRLAARFDPRLVRQRLIGDVGRRAAP